MTELNSTKQHFKAHFITLFGEHGERLHNRMTRKRQNANDRNIPYSLTLADVAMVADKLLGNGVCDYTGLPFDPPDGECPDYSPSLERIDDTRGYVRGNICVVTRRANQLKDVLWDKQRKTTLQKRDHDVVKNLVERLSQSKLEELKTAYIPPGEMVFQEDGSITFQINGKEEAFVEKTTPLSPDLPEDVLLAERYSRLVRFLVGRSQEVELSFVQFKAAYRAKRCFITGEALTADLSPVILDRNLPVASGNIKFAQEQAATALNNLCEVTGLSVADLTKNLKRSVG